MAIQVDTSPLVSCVMPTFGRPAYVNESVAMFLAQDYPAKELIVLNDCAGQTYCGDLPGVRIVNAPRRYPTLGEKRNAAIELAEGPIVAVWDDDDVYLPWRLSFSVRQMQQWNTPFYRPAEFWAYWGDAKLHNNQSVPGWISHPNTMFTKELWRRAGSYPAMGVGEDARFFEQVHRELRKEFIKYPIDREKRFFVLRGKSRYAHMSIDGGEQPLDTTPGEYPITPAPIEDHLLKEVCEGLIAAYKKMPVTHL